MPNFQRDKPPGPYESLSHKAETAKDDDSIRDLFVEIQRRTLGCDLAKTFLERLVRVQRRFQQGKKFVITESALADAVNALGYNLNPGLYSGTNALQIHLLRVHQSRELGTLLAAPATPESQQEAFTPAGAVYIGFFLLRQKLANRAWFGDPDEQNKTWISAQTRHQGPATTKSQYRLTIQPEPVEETNFRIMLKNDLPHKGSGAAHAFGEFLQSLGF